MSEEVDEWRARAGCAKATGFPEDSLSTPLYLLAVDDCAFRRVLLPQPSAEGGEGKLGGITSLVLVSRGRYILSSSFALTVLHLIE